MPSAVSLIVPSLEFLFLIALWIAIKYYCVNVTFGTMIGFLILFFIINACFSAVRYILFYLEKDTTGSKLLNPEITGNTPNNVNNNSANNSVNNTVEYPVNMQMPVPDPI